MKYINNVTAAVSSFEISIPLHNLWSYIRWDFNLFNIQSLAPTCSAPFLDAHLMRIAPLKPLVCLIIVSYVQRTRWNMALPHFSCMQWFPMCFRPITVTSLICFPSLLCLSAPSLPPCCCHCHCSSSCTSCCCCYCCCCCCGWSIWWRCCGRLSFCCVV